MNFEVKVITNSKKPEIQIKNQQITIKVRSAPKNGKANSEVKTLLEKQLKCKVEIIKGSKNKQKTITCSLTEEKFKQFFKF